jgi:hypothetical protein
MTLLVFAFLVILSVSAVGQLLIGTPYADSQIVVIVNPGVMSHKRVRM